jgi:hypothetical protein
MSNQSWLFFFSIVTVDNMSTLMYGTRRFGASKQQRGICSAWRLWINPVHGDTSHIFEHIFESAPRLRKLSLSSRFVWNGLSGSWAQLTELDTGYVSYTVGDCLALLQSTRNLQKLRVHIGSGVVEGHRRLALSHPLVSLHDLGGGSLRDAL